LAAPTPTPTRSAPPRARRILGLLLGGLALVAVLVGCSTFDALTDLQGDLEEEGFSDVTANIAPTDASAVVISASAPEETTPEEAQDRAADVVWQQFPRRFEVLRVTIDGEEEQWSYAQLREELGPRPDDLDTSKEIGEDLTRSATAVVLGATAAGVLLVGFIGLVVVLGVRARRRSSPALPRPHPQPWMPPSMPSATPSPPPGGWAPASAPPGPPGSAAAPGPPAPPAPGGSPEANGSTGVPDAPPTASRPTSAPAPGGAPTPTPPVPAPPSLAKGPAPEQGRPVPPAPPVGRRRRDPDARRLGRRPRGPVPDPAHTPPGWG